MDKKTVNTLFFVLSILFLTATAGLFGFAVYFAVHAMLLFAVASFFVGVLCLWLPKKYYMSVF